MTKPVSIWDVAPPPYEQYLYVMAHFAELQKHGAMVAVGFQQGGFKEVTYPPGELGRARKEAEELAALIATTRSLLGLKFNAGVQLF